MPTCELVRRSGQVADFKSAQTDTSTGSRDTEVKEFAAKPTGLPSMRAATAVTPVGKAEKTRRSSFGERTSPNVGVGDWFTTQLQVTRAGQARRFHSSASSR